MEPQIKTKQAISTRMGITILIGAIGAFALGGFIFYSLGKTSTSTTTTPTSTTITTPSGAQPLELYDITDVDAATSPAGEGISPISEVKFWGYQAGSNSNLLFGTYDNGVYTDGNVTSNSLPLMVQLGSNGNSHQSLIITIKPGLPPTQQRSSLGIPQAHAQVTMSSTICLPEKQGSSTAYAPVKSPIFGIPTAQAQVNTNIEPEEPTTWHTYYVDEDGNVYTDSNLTLMINTENCQNLISRTFSPSDLVNVSSSAAVYPDGSNWLVLAKTWRFVLGFYNTPDGFIDHETDTLWSEAPLFITSGNTSAETLTLPEQTLTITADFGTKNVCFPQQVLATNEWFVFFVDENGKPYSDVMLQNQIPCGTSNNCSSINCIKYPNHPCCLEDTPAIR